MSFFFLLFSIRACAAKDQRDGGNVLAEQDVEFQHSCHNSSLIAALKRPALVFLPPHCQPAGSAPCQRRHKEHAHTHTHTHGSEGSW